MARVAMTFALGLACAGSAQADPSIATEAGLDGFLAADRLPAPEDPFLALGHRIYGGTCQNCHGGNRATGAPKVTSLADWAPRLDQGLEVLFDHALTGFVGPRYTQMPARGANPALTDTEVMAAVTYMVWLSGGGAMAETYLKTRN